MWNYYKLNTEGLQNNAEIIRDSAGRTFDKATPHQHLTAATRPQWNMEQYLDLPAT